MKSICIIKKRQIKKKKKKIIGNTKNKFNQSFKFSNSTSEIFVNCVDFDFDVIIFFCIIIHVIVFNLFVFMRNIVWILDFDVDHHCLNDWSVFIILNIGDSEVIETANNQRILVENNENAEIFIETNTLCFTNILFVSDFTINLISVCMLNNCGIFVFFEVNKTASLIVYNDIFIVFVNYTYNQFVFCN